MSVPKRRAPVGFEFHFRCAAVNGDIVKSTLCKDGDDYIYKLVVRDSGGQLKTVVVDARNPGAAAAPATEGVQSLRSRP